jgi:hypothetical protein
MAGVVLFAGVATNGSHVPRHGIDADTPRMDSSLSSLSLQQPKNNCDSSSLRPTQIQEEVTNMNMKAKAKDDVEDIPMAYLGYVLLAIMAMVIAAVVLVIRLL